MKPLGEVDMENLEFCALTGVKAILIKDGRLLSLDSFPGHQIHQPGSKRQWSTIFIKNCLPYFWLKQKLPKLVCDQQKKGEQKDLYLQQKLKPDSKIKSNEKTSQYLNTV